MNSSSTSNSAYTYTVEVIVVNAAVTQDSPSDLFYKVCPLTHVTLSHTQVPLLIAFLSSAQDER